MDVSGSYTLYLPRERVWQALLDPAVLQRVVPGCEALEQVEDGTYKGRVRVGIAAVKGTYEGTLRLIDRQPPADCTITADGIGARGVIHGEGTIHLDAADGGTTVITYSGKAQLGGAIASVGTRVVGAAANMLIRSFFAALADTHSAGTPASAASGPADLITASDNHPAVHAPATGSVETLARGDDTSLGTATRPGASTSQAPPATSHDALAGLVRRLGLSDGSRESERRWSNRIVLSGLVAASVAVALVVSILARLARR